mgnify:CR=1 FL=1
MTKHTFLAFLLLAAPAFAEDLYEDYHSGFGSSLGRAPADTSRSLNPLIQQGLGDYDHDGTMDKFDFDSDNDGMINTFDRDSYDSKRW